jgi:SAM-dependent methyltransferase
MLNDPKIAFMTTLGVNVGDEFIREGIFSFFDEIFPNWTPFYVNKHDLLSLEALHLDELTTLGDKFRDADIIVQSGAPVYWKIGESSSYSVEWAEELWEKRIFALGPQKPILNIAAGACQPYPDFAHTFLSDPRCVEFARKAAAACRWTSVRDPLASQILCALGVEHEALPCAALHAARRTNFKGTFGGVVGVNLMPLGGHFRLRDDFDDDVWNAVCQALVKSLRKYHRLLFIAHDASEKAFMERYRGEGEVIFLSGSWRDYLHVYAKSSAVVSNRVHGAVCAAGFGRPTVIIGNDTRLMIGDFIGIPSLYAMEAKAGQVVDLIEDGIRGQKAEGERLIHLREESAGRYRSAILESIFQTGRATGTSSMAKKSGRTSGTKKFALASKAEFCSGSFQDLMLTLNCFAERWGLRRLSTTLEGWEYPWFLFNAFDGADWSQVRLLDMDSDLNPMPWFMASLGAQVELVGKRGMRTAQWEEVRRRTGLKVDWQVPSINEVRIPEQCYDVVTCFSAAEPCPGQDTMVAEAAKALRSGGTFLISLRLRPPSRGLSLPWRSSGVLTIKKFTQTIWEHPAFGVNAENPGWGLRPDDILVEKDGKCRFPGPVTAGAAVLRKK